MTINVSEALDSDTSTVVSVRRYEGQYVDGIYTKSLSKVFKTLCSVQQPSNKALQMLSEGERLLTPRVFICAKKVRVANDHDGTLSDVIVYKKNNYRVVTEGDWSDYGYTTVIGVRD